MAHYIHDEKNNRIEGMSKEEIYALLAEAIQEGEMPSVDTPTAFVTMIKSIVDGKPYKMGLCTQAQYNDLEAQGLLETDALYIITDDETYNDLINYINTQDAALSDRITANTNNIATNTANIATNTTEIAANTVNINKLVNELKQVKLYTHYIEIKTTALQNTNRKIYFTLILNTNDNINTAAKLKAHLIDEAQAPAFGTYEYGNNEVAIVTGYYYDSLNDRFYIAYQKEQGQAGSINHSAITYAELDLTDLIISDTVAPLLNIGDYIINDPTVSYVETGEQGGLIYADVVITNPNATALTLYYKTSTDANYSTTTIAANGTYTIGNYVEGTSGTVYLSTGAASSNIINWTV